MNKLDYNNPLADPNSMKVKRTSVIRVECTVGTGKIEEPYRRIYRYYTSSGTLIGEISAQTTITENQAPSHQNGVTNVVLKMSAVSEKEIENAVKLASKMQKEYSCNCTLFTV